MIDSTRTLISGPAIPVRGHDIDTDRIIPARYLKCVVFEGLGEHAFEDDRAQQKRAGTTHAFDDARFANARILLVNRNFGCGSSREHAPQAIMRWRQGIQAIVGESFAEIFQGNCLAMGVPVVTVDAGDMAMLMDLAEGEPTLGYELDLVERRLTAGDFSVPVRIADGPRQQLVEGRWDSMGELLAATADIEKTAAALPYFASWR
jgi:3-isopropylmalate/(R)-2-methylmalate dehydratase small subunit